ncbi:MAG: porin, partial [Steroidobacteraceae bacterium]
MSRSLATALAVLACAAGVAHADTKLGENTTIGGKAFIDLTNVDQRNNDVQQAGNGFGADVKRFYLSATHDFGDIWSANVTTDFQYSSTLGATELFVKKAYLQAKLSDAFWVRAGSADLPWVPMDEDQYGYRFVENVLVDRLKFGTSADWGVHVGGKFSDGRFNYAVSVINGNGYKNPTRSKSMDVEARVGFVPVKGLTLALGAYSGKLGKDVETGTSTGATLHNASRITALAAYKADRFRVGGEYFTADNWNNVTTTATDKADGFSLWGGYDFTKQLAAFARFDSAKTSRDLAPGLKDTYFNVGLDYKPRKNIDLAFVVKNEKAENGSV